MITLHYIKSLTSFQMPLASKVVHQHSTNTCYMKCDMDDGL